MKNIYIKSKHRKIPCFFLVLMLAGLASCTKSESSDLSFPFLKAENDSPYFEIESKINTGTEELSEKKLLEAQYPELAGKGDEIDYALLFLQSANDLKAQSRYEEALNHFQRVLELEQGNFEAIWNISCIYSELGSALSNPAHRAEFYNNAELYAKKALLLNPKNANANYAIALVYFKKSEIVNNREKWQLLKQVKGHLDNAVSMLPDHHQAWFLMGLWKYNIANLDNIELTRARLGLGNIVNDGTYEKASEAFEKALEYRPQTIIYNYYYGKALIEVNDTDKAKLYLHRASRLPVKSKFDPNHKQKAEELLRSLG